MGNRFHPLKTATPKLFKKFNPLSSNGFIIMLLPQLLFFSQKKYYIKAINSYKNKYY
jgi:hypothetical protein